MYYLIELIKRFWALPRYFKVLKIIKKSGVLEGKNDSTIKVIKDFVLYQEVLYRTKIDTAGVINRIYKDEG